MKHMLFALFEEAREAEAALQEVEADETCRGAYSVVMHEDRLRDGDVELVETGVRGGMALGALLGAAGGAMLGGLVAGPLGLIGGGPLFAALMGGTYGTLYGGLAGTLGGLGGPDEGLKQLADQLEAGKILVSVNIEGIDCEARIEAIFQRHGALESHRRFG